ncbi:MAG TPA: NAD(P)H-quinone oxidoreductase [Longimicrobiaceae bacterium]|nr:NAD(P)H-quinone oxidoreductase [Longimicrobiaceae bacterium]
MRAVTIPHSGPPDVLKLDERPTPEPGPSEIRVRVRASALNRADLLQRRGKYPVPAGAPADIGGLEYAGEVDAVGEGAGLWAPGSRVMGIVGGGGHAEYVVVHEREAMRVPQNLTWEQAAAIPEAYLTAYDALFHRLDLQVGERVLIHAVGSGVGTAALQLAHAAGARTIGTSRSPEKLKRAAELGLGIGIDSTSDDWVQMVKSETGGEGVHAILDLVGGSYLAGNLSLLALKGRIVVVGIVGGAKADMDLGILMQKRAQITGTVLRARPLEEKIALAREFSDVVLPLFSSDRIGPIIDRTYPFSEIQQAHRHMEANQNFGKIVLLW